MANGIPATSQHRWSHPTHGQATQPITGTNWRHSPATQNSSLPQLWPQEPQCPSSAERSTQSEPHGNRPPPHAQRPPTQSDPSPQSTSQSPQCMRSVQVSTHAEPPHSTRPPSHLGTHRPSWHNDAETPHATSQLPQLSVSTSRRTHRLPQPTWSPLRQRSQVRLAASQYSGSGHWPLAAQGEPTPIGGGGGGQPATAATRTVARRTAVCA